MFFRYRIEGETNLPDSGGCILVCNHNYGIDSVLLATTAHRQVYFMAKAELFRINPLVTWYLRETGVFPVERGKRDIRALRTAVETVRGGKILGMFPEGTRSRDENLQRGKTGTARIAIAAGVPVVPAVVVGSAQAFSGFWKPRRRPEVTVRYGEPLYWDNSAEGESASIVFTEQIMRAIASLLPPEIRGVYSEQAEVTAP